MRPTLIRLAICALTTAVLAPAAHAGTLSLQGGTYVYSGAPGERNSPSLSFTTDMDGALVMSLRDFAAPVALDGPAAASCLPDEFIPGQVTCVPGSVVVLQGNDGDDTMAFTAWSDSPAPPGFRAVLDGGAGNDTIQGSDLADEIAGGPGNDKVEAGRGDDLVDGGDGDDRLSAGDGADRVLAGAGDDLLSGDMNGSGASISPDLLDGGPGTDTIDTEWIGGSSTGAGFDVRATADGVADDGRIVGGAREGDDVRGVERIVNLSGQAVEIAGGDGPDELNLTPNATGPGRIAGLGGDDVLDGGAGPDAIDGGPGADRIKGMNGDDVITGGPGRDTIQGDFTGGCLYYGCSMVAGNDTIHARDGEVDSVDCGPGQDSVVADAADVVSASCESVDRGPAAAGGGQGPAPGAGGASPPAARPAALRIAGLPARLPRAALARGLKLKVAAPAAGQATVTLVRGRRAVVLGRMRLRAGEQRVRLRSRAAVRPGPARVRLVLVTGTRVLRAEVAVRVS